MMSWTEYENRLRKWHVPIDNKGGKDYHGKMNHYKPMSMHRARAYIKAYFETPNTENLTASISDGHSPESLRLTVIKNRHMRVLTFSEPFELYHITAALVDLVEELS